MKTLIVLIVLLVAVPCFAVSPDKEVWEYGILGYPEYKATYAFKESNTYLLFEDELFYKVPCRKYTGGGVCAFYTPYYAFMFQKLGLSYGIVHSFFALGYAIEFSGYGIIPVPLIFKLTKIGYTDEYPPEVFIDVHPYLFY